MVDKINFQMCIPSVPVVVIAHTCQKVPALATVTWVNAGEQPFDEEEKIKWDQVSNNFIF